MDSVLRMFYNGMVDQIRPYPRNGEHRRLSHAFTDGFRLGALTMLEVLTGE